MRTNRIWFFIGGVLLVAIAAFLLWRSNVQKGVFPLTADMETPTISTPIVLNSATPTVQPSPISEATLSPEMQTLIDGPEQITVFTFYDTFDTTGSVPDPQKWQYSTGTADSPQPISLSIEDGSLSVDVATAINYSPEVLQEIEINPDNFVKDLNAVSVVISSKDGTSDQFQAGLEVDLTDGKTDYTFRCFIGYFQIDTSYTCELENATLNRDLDSFSFKVPVFHAHKIDIEWNPSSGQLLAFLNGQFIQALNIEPVAPLQVSNVELYVKRLMLNGHGAVSFDDVQMGSFRASQVVFPGEFIPAQDTNIQESTARLNFLLYDDFEHPLYDGYLSQHNWEVISDQPLTLIQQNGVLTFGGEASSASLHFSRLSGAPYALQVDFLPLNDLLVEGNVWIALTAFREQDHVMMVSYFCSFDPSETGVWINCHYESPDRVIHSQGTPVRVDRVNTLRITCNPEQGACYAEINGVLFDKIFLTESDENQINLFGLQPEIGVRFSSFQTVAIDNVLMGIVRSDPQPEPESIPPEIISTLPHSDLYMWDDFDNPDYDTIFHPRAWVLLSPGPGNPQETPIQVGQQDGRLVETPGSGNERHIWVNQFEPLTFQEINAMQIDVLPNITDIGDEETAAILSFYGVSSQSTPNGSVFSCYLVYYRNSGVQARYNCRVCIDGQPCSPDGWVVVPATAHTIAIEADPETHTFYGYLDGVQMCAIESPYLDQYQFDLHIYGTEVTSSLDFDNAMLGIPASHPDVLSMPISPYPTWQP